MATREDIKKPAGTDFISAGDNAITDNANVLETLWDTHEATRELADKAMKVYPITDGYPAGPVTSWYGFDNEGIYRFPSQAQVDLVTGWFPGAGPGHAEVVAQGSTTSVVTYTEWGIPARQMQITVSSSAGNRTQWKQTGGTKLAATSMTLGRASDVREATDVAHSVPFDVAVDVYSYRMHLRNTNDRTTNTITGSLNITEIGIGEMAVGTFGQDTGNIVSGTYKRIQAAASTSSAGSEFTTAFVRDYPMMSAKRYVLRYGFTAPAGQQVNYLEGGSWTITGGTAQLTADAPAMTVTNRTPLDLWMEVEVDWKTRIEAVLGDSLAVGQGATLPVFNSWFARRARRQGFIPMFFAHAGSRFSEWTNAAHIKIRKYSLPTYKIAKPDLLHVPMGSNDLFAEDRTVEQMLDSMSQALPLVMAVTTDEVVLETILPRLDANDPNEVNRKEWNEYLKTNLPFGAISVYDIASPFTDETGGVLLPKYRTSEGDIHMNDAGYALESTLVN